MCVCVFRGRALCRGSFQTWWHLELLGKLDNGCGLPSIPERAVKDGLEGISATFGDCKWTVELEDHHNGTWNNAQERECRFW